MYIEVMAELPRQDDTAEFERSVQAAKDAGAVCVRTACLGGRRYENFSNLADWQAFVGAAASRDRSRAARSSRGAQIPLAIENHKDWTAEELAALMK